MPPALSLKQRLAALSLAPSAPSSPSSSLSPSLLSFSIPWQASLSPFPPPAVLVTPAAAIYAVYTSPNHPPIPNHLPTLIVTPHGMFVCIIALTSKINAIVTGQPANILYSYLHTNYVSTHTTRYAFPLLTSSNRTPRTIS